jgi:dUTP pyrophosphatase
MKVMLLHQNAELPTKGSQYAGAYDIYMPEGGFASAYHAIKVGLGFAAEVPAGYVALLLPRSGVGALHGLELHNTCGVIDADYRGEWIATLKTKKSDGLHWQPGDRLLQYLLVPVLDSPPERVHALLPTRRADGGFGSTG